MLRRLLNEEQPEHIAVVFDARGPTFRHELYEDYKANRPPMPAELAGQVEAILEFVRILGLPLIQVEGVEADDVIGTLSRIAEQQGMECVISTGDKDLAQLVSDHTTLVNTMTDTHLDRAAVREKFGVTPEQFVDFLTLTGDKSDNIPGVDKVGPKTATKWLQEYGSLEQLMDRADEIGGKIGENLRAARETLPLSRELVTIRRDLDLPDDPAGLRRRPVDEPRLREALRRFEFNSWLKELGEDDAPAEAAGTTDYRTIFTEKELEQLIERLEQAELVAFYTETPTLDPLVA